MKWLLHNKLYFLSQRFRGEPVAAALKELRKSLHFDESKLRELQCERLIALLQHAVTQVPFYQQSFGAFKPEIMQLTSVADVYDLMERLPVLEKTTLLTHRNQFMAPKKWATATNISSGTTGVPFSFPCDQVSWAYRHASIIRCLELYGVAFGEPYGYFFGQHWKSEFQLKTKVKDWFFNRFRFSAFEITTEHAKEAYTWFQKKKATYWFGYPSTMVAFCKICENELDLSVKQLHLKMVMATGETLEPYQKRYLEQVLKCRVINYYGSAEGGAGAFEGPEGMLHENMETTYLQWNADNKIIKTDLFLRQFPLIKIQTDDVIHRQEIPKVTHFKHRQIGQLQGRTGGIVQLPSGETIHSIVFDYFFDLFLDFSQVRQFRFEIGKKEMQLIVEVSGTKDGEDVLLTALKEELYHRFPNEGISISLVNQLPTLANGKNRPWVYKN